MKIFEIFDCSGQFLSNSLCQFWNEESIPLQIFYPSYFFRSNNIYFAQKKPIKIKILETYECSGQHLSNFLCQFWNDKSIPLQILYLYLVSWKIIPMFFFSSNNIYFAQEEPIKVKILETFKCLGHILSNSLCLFWNEESISLQVLYPSSILWKITPLYFFSSSNINFAHKEPIKMKSWWDFRLLRSKFVEFLMPILKRRVDSSPNFVSLFSFMKDNSPVLF